MFFGDRILRFGDILARIPAIYRKVLTQQLKELVNDGLVIREEYKELLQGPNILLRNLVKLLKIYYYKRKNGDQKQRKFL